MNKSLSQALARTLGTSTVGLESVDVDINIGTDIATDEDGAPLSSMVEETNEPIIEAQETTIAEENENINTMDSDSEASEDDIETLESIQLNLQKSLDHGGLDTVSVEMFNITMNHVYRKYGISSSNVMPSMESFEADRLGQTQLALERVEISLESIKDNVTKMLKALYKRVMNFIKTVSKFCLDVSKRAKATVARAKAARGGKVTTSNETVSPPNAHRLVPTGKNTVTSQAMISDYNSRATVLNEYKRMVDELSDYLQSRVYAAKNGTYKPGDNATIVSSVERAMKALPNQGLILLEAPADGGIPKIEFKMPPVPNGDTAIALPCLSVDDVVVLATQAEKCAGIIGTMGNGVTDNKTEKAVIELGYIADNSSDPAVKKDIAELQKFARSTLNVASRGVSHFANINKTVVDWCFASLSTVAKANAKTTA